MAAKELIPVTIDTREQRPWPLDPTRFAVTRGTLHTGDYALTGYESQICLERKGLGDWVQTVIADWIRFRKELYRLAGFDMAAIVVEATVEDVLAHRYESDASPASVLGRANGCWLDHGTPVYFWGSRTAAVTMAESFFTLAWKKLRGAA